MEEANESRGERYLEYFTAILLGLTTTLGAVAAYYNTLWSGSANENFIHSVMNMNDANAGYLAVMNRATDNKLDEMKNDIYYVQWRNMREKKDADSAYFFSGLDTAFQNDLLHADAADFATSRYGKMMQERANELQVIYAASDSASKAALQKLEAGQKEGKHGDDFTLITVLYTVVLFFSGFASLRSSARLRMIYIVCATAVFVGTTVWFFMLPFPS